MVVLKTEPPPAYTSSGGEHPLKSENRQRSVEQESGGTSVSRGQLEAEVEVGPSTLDTRSTTILYTQQDSEGRRLRALKEQLRNAIGAYKTARAGNGNEETMQHHQDTVLGLMNELADAVSDPGAKAHYREKASRFTKATEKKDGGIIRGVMRGFLLLFAVPFGLAVVVLFALGVIFQGVGEVLRGIGDMLTLGMKPKLIAWLRKRQGDDWDSDSESG